MRNTIKRIITSNKFNRDVFIRSGVRTFRSGKGTSFISVSDGSSVQPIQVVETSTLLSQLLKSITTGASVEVRGLRGISSQKIGGVFTKTPNNAKF